MTNEKKFFDEEKLYYSLTYEDTIQILNLIDDYQYRNLNIELGDLKLKVDKKGMKGNKTDEVETIQEESSQTYRNDKQEEKVSSETEGNESINNHEGDSEVTEKDVNDNNNLEMNGTVAVDASITGVFYKSPSPGEDPYVQIGSEVKKGDELGLVEVMKLFNTINAPCDGVIKEILVEDESVVNVEDVLMVIEPA